MKNFRIIVVGLGYVGMSNAVLLAQNHSVVGVDSDDERVLLVNQKKTTVYDPEISNYLDTQVLDIKATSPIKVNYNDADFIIIATPTNYNEETNCFNTSSVESVIKEVLSQKSQAMIVVKSTIPVGFTNKLRAQFNSQNIIFCPEFLREGRALYDNLYPSRIIIGGDSSKAKLFADIIKQGAIKADVPVLFMGSTEAEASKLFANTYLAMRVAFFNELDSYSLTHSLDTRNIIDAIGLDPRIGSHYNNPSFGYGGYCLPKDTKQLLANYKEVPQKIIEAIVSSNRVRIDFIADQIVKRKPKVLGVYRLIMKSESDNIRESSMRSVIERIKSEEIEIVIYEPLIKEEYFSNSRVIVNLDEFIKASDIILANRNHSDLKSCKSKVFTRDLFQND